MARRPRIGYGRYADGALCCPVSRGWSGAGGGQSLRDQHLIASVRTRWSHCWLRRVICHSPEMQNTALTHSQRNQQLAVNCSHRGMGSQVVLVGAVGSRRPGGGVASFEQRLRLQPAS
jgi:hypothetical protein